MPWSLTLPRTRSTTDSPFARFSSCKTYKGFLLPARSSTNAEKFMRASLYNSQLMGEVKLQTYWVDSDPAGIVYFAHFFRLVEQAEEELYLQKGIYRQDLLDKYSIWMPRVEAHVNFATPIRNGQAIRIRINPVFQRQK